MKAANTILTIAAVVIVLGGVGWMRWQFCDALDVSGWAFAGCFVQ